MILLSSKSVSRSVVVLAIVTLLAVAMPLALAAGEREFSPSMIQGAAGVETPGELVVERPVTPISGGTTVFVTSTDPASGGDGSAVFEHGPYFAHSTLNLYIVTMFDLEGFGEGAFDQVTRFILPDGSVFGTIIKPLNVDSAPGETIKRADLASHPVPVVKPVSALRLGPMMTAQEKSANLDSQVFTAEVLPVSGTWITQHNLYGTWTVEVFLVRDEEVLSDAQTTFEIGIDF